MTDIIDIASTDNGRALATVIRSGKTSRKVRVEWPMVGSWISFDSTYEYDLWLYLRTFGKMLGVTHALRNTTKLPFPEPVEYVAGNGATYTLRAYRPDFLVIGSDGTTTWVEVKGWQNEKHLATRKAIERFYPELPIRLVTKEDLLKIQREHRDEIEGWVAIK